MDAESCSITTRLSVGRAVPSTLWRQPAFVTLWAGQSVSALGSMMTMVAFPLTAVLVLDASPEQMGVLAACRTAPVLVLGLLAGAWVDRLRRRPLMLASDLGRAVALASVPVAGALGWLRLEQLYVVAAAVGALTVIFDVAYQAYLPTLVGRAELVAGNSALETSSSAAEVVGPAVAGALVQAITPLWTLLFDAATFLVSAGSLALIRTREPAPRPPGPRPGLWPEVRQGLAFVARDPRLRALTGCSATRSLFGGFFDALYVVFASRDLGLPAALVGLLVGLGGVGALLGAAATGRITDRVGPGRTLVGAALLAGSLNLLVPVAALPGAPAPALLGAAQLLGDGAAIIYIVVAVSYRQTVTPDTLLGRTNATVRSLTVGAQLVGAVVGGLLAVAFGTALALLIAAVGMLLAPAWLVLSPVPALETAAPD